ncbi:hypothetical protein AXF42_Ash014783 [Apostasia shenzhenica]|uniref:Succinate dehydrogenase assembly factor 2, mitochondrial n=1 Tax=Apostasia shenzhenica TaxID=1088818 RepID=A0A2H9ZWC4_9ASPA|nr:hypothetical protein AXF42_Ash014783 [Apostasia shenzhenica]
MAFLRRVLLCGLQKNPGLNSVSLLHRRKIGLLSRFSSEHGQIEINLSDAESTRRLRNRLLYRSRQRGFLELDLILGKWVEENIHFMDEARIRSLVDVLDLCDSRLVNLQENPDLWKWLSGQEQPPDAINNNQVFRAMHSKVLENLNSHSAPATRADPGQRWVRGWDDKSGPKYGNQ